MTKNIPWVKEYLSDELKEIAMLSLAERGAYYSLKLIYHTNPEAFNSVQILFAMCLAFSEDERTAVRTVVERLFKQENKFPFNSRLNLLENQALIGLDQKKLAGVKSGEARRAKRTAVRTISESESESEEEEERKKESKKEDVQKKFSAFDEFWEIYGFKKGKAKAEQSYKKAIKNGVTHDEIMRGTERYKAELFSKGTDSKYWKHPTTWLNGEHWNDEYTECNFSKPGKSDAAKQALVRGLTIAPRY